MAQEIQSNLLKGGMTVRFRDAIYQVIQSQHIKPGKGSAFTKVKFKNLENGRNIEITLKPVDKIEQLYSEEKNMEYLYRDGSYLVFMDQDNYEQESVEEKLVEEAIGFLKENMKCQCRFVEGRLVSVELPKQEVYTITQTDPGLKGDTAQGGSKPATLESGAVVNVPLFVNEGEKIRVDTRSGEYIERAN